MDMFGIGMPELIVILIIVVFVFGTSRIGEIGGAIGKSIRNFKSASEEEKPSIDQEQQKKG